MTNVVPIAIGYGFRLVCYKQATNVLNYIKRYKNAQIPKPKYLSIFIFNSTKMKSLNIISVLFFSIMILSCNPTDNTTQTGHKDFSIGEIVEFYSDVLKEDRTINIYLPQGYSPGSLKAYPVIYLLDGSADEDFIHVSGLVQFASFPWIQIMPETIVVGISNIDRKKDFTYPSNSERDQKEFPTTGGSENFIKFIETELQPFITKNYKITTTKTLIGQSLGGLLATEILLKKPELFDNYIIVSPSLWWDDEALLDYKSKSYTTSKSIYVAVGKEGEVMERVANELYEKVNVEKASGTKIYFNFLEKRDHGDVLHLAAYDAFEKIFKKEASE